MASLRVDASSTCETDLRATNLLALRLLTISPGSREQRESTDNCCLPLACAARADCGNRARTRVLNISGAAESTPLATAKPAASGHR